MDPHTHWEWFSIRFFDDEEVMLFAFPQQNYYDGTYITRDKKTKLVRNYKYFPKSFTEITGMKFSRGWDLHMPGIKDEKYELRPVIDGQTNHAYFELLTEVFNPKGEKVGFCITELLPGARNPDQKIKLSIFKEV